MHGHVHVTLQQRIFNFFGKKALAFHFVESQVLNLITLCFDDD